MTENKKVGRNRILVYLLGILAVMAMVMILPLVFGERAATVLPREWTYEVYQWGEGVIIKDEKLYQTDFDGEIYPVVKEGERVRVGDEVAEVVTLKDTTDLKNQLEIIENWIAFLENSSSLGGISNNLSNMDLIISAIQAEVLGGNVANVNQLKESLQLLKSPDINNISDSDYSTSNLEELRIRRTQLLNNLSQYARKMYSNHSGIVSFIVDGFEDVLSFNSIMDLDASLFEEIKNEKINENYIFKIIDSTEWYIGILVEDDQTEYTLGKSYEINLKNKEEEALILRIPLVEEITDRNNRIMVFKSTNYIGDIYNYRIVDSGILLSRDAALGVPNSAIFEKDGIEGVFIKEFYDVVRFRRVDILGVVDDTTYVSRGNNDGYLTIKDGERIKTLTLHDEVIKDPSSVYEGQILK